MTDENRKKMADRLASMAEELDQMRGELLVGGVSDVSNWINHDRAAFRLVDESHWRLGAAAVWLRIVKTVEAEKETSNGIF
jgi:hypothetical protein